MLDKNEVRFRAFHVNPHYIALKNHLYNYLVRKKAVVQGITSAQRGPVLEVGSGLSPMLTRHSHLMVYTDLSFEGLRYLRRINPKGVMVVADCTRLPFRTDVFAQVVCSEVLEHIQHDRRAIHELARVMDRHGRLHLTFPHRKPYFALDDRFVGHFRRYELSEMLEKLTAEGLQPKNVRNVLGPFDKCCMVLCILVLSVLGCWAKRQSTTRSRRPPRSLVVLFQWLNLLVAAIARLDARIMPRALCAVLLVRADKGMPPVMHGSQANGVCKNNAYRDSQQPKGT